MTLNPKTIMLQAKNQVTNSGGAHNDEETPINRAILTMQQYNESCRLYGEASQFVQGNKPELHPEILEAFSNRENAPMSIAAPDALRDMEMLLGEDMSRALRYLMKTIPAIEVHGAEANDTGVIYALKYKRADNTEFFLATAIRPLGSDESISVWFPNTEFDSAYEATPIARRLYKHALGITGLASKYFGQGAEPFPEPAV